MDQPTLWDWMKEGATKLKTDGATAAPLGVRGSLGLSELPQDLKLSVGKAQRLHRDLEDALGVVDLIVTNNRRRMLSTRRRKNRQEIRLHHMFVGCEPKIVQAIVQMACGESKGRDEIRDYISQNRGSIIFEPEQDALQALGAHHDLDALLTCQREELNDPILDDICITWGRDGRGRRSIRFGSFDFDQRLIRVHPVLDQSWVPEYFVEFIVYHELLHALCPPVMLPGKRRSIHPPKFRELEKRFPHYEKAIEWESAHIRKILDRK